MLKYYSTTVLAFLFILLLTSHNAYVQAQYCMNEGPSSTGNSKGNMIISANVQANTYVNILDLATGTYFVKYTENGFATMLKLMKQP